MTSPSDFGRLGLCDSTLSLWLYWFWKSSDIIAWRHSPPECPNNPSHLISGHCHCGGSRPYGGPHSDCQTSINIPIEEHRVDVKSYTSKTLIKIIHGGRLYMSTINGVFGSALPSSVFFCDITACACAHFGLCSTKQISSSNPQKIDHHDEMYSSSLCMKLLMHALNYTSNSC